MKDADVKRAIASAEAALAEDSSLTEQDVDRFCDANCTWSDHHPDCKYGTQEQFKKEVKHD